MESLAVGLLLFLLGNFWIIGGWLLRKVYEIDNKLKTEKTNTKRREERISSLEESVDDHEGRLCNLESHS